jgi:hypothetical protein
MNEKAKYMTVLDSEIGRVFQYKVSTKHLRNESCEDFITRKGHRLSNCQWMVHEIAEFRFIKNSKRRLFIVASSPRYVYYHNQQFKL